MISSEREREELNAFVVSWWRWNCFSSIFTFNLTSIIEQLKTIADFIYPVIDFAFNFKYFFHKCRIVQPITIQSKWLLNFFIIIFLLLQFFAWVQTFYYFLFIFYYFLFIFYSSCHELSSLRGFWHHNVVRVVVGRIEESLPIIRGKFKVNRVWSSLKKVFFFLVDFFRTFETKPTDRRSGHIQLSLKR